MLRTRVADKPETFARQIEHIAAMATMLCEHVEKHGATARDLAIIVELNQRYLDVLDSILDSEIEIHVSDTERRMLYS